MVFPVMLNGKGKLEFEKVDRKSIDAFKHWF